MTQVEKQVVEKALSNNPDLMDKLCNLTNEELDKVAECVEMFDLMKNQDLPCDKDLNSVGLIMDLYSEHGAYWTALHVFAYGRIQGIRAERAKRKARKLSE